MKLRVVGCVICLSLVVATCQAQSDVPIDLATKGEPNEPLPREAKLRLGANRLIFPDTIPNTTFPDTIPAGASFHAPFALIPPDYSTLVVADSQQSIRRFDIYSGNPLSGAAATGMYYQQVVLSSDGKRALIPGEKLIVLDLASGGKLAEISRPDGLARMLQHRPEFALSANGKILAQGGAEVLRDDAGSVHSGNGMVVVWDVDKAKELIRVRTIQDSWSAPTLSPDGKVLATFGFHGWKRNTASVAFPQSPYPIPPTKEVPTTDPTESDPGATVQVWNVETGKELFKTRLTGSAACGAAVCFAADGAMMAASTGGAIDLVEVKTGKLIRTLLGRTGQGRQIAFSPDGKVLASMDSLGTVQRWNIGDGQLLGTTKSPALSNPIKPIKLAYADDTRAVVWGKAGSTAVSCEVPSGKLLARTREHAGSIGAIGFRAGGKEVVTVGGGHVVRWDVATGKSIGDIDLLPAESRALTISHDGIYAFARGHSSAIYDLSTGEELFAIPQAPRLPGMEVRSTTREWTEEIPSADLRRVVALRGLQGNAGRRVCVVWDVPSRRKVGQFEPTSCQDGRIVFSPSGDRVVTFARPTYPPSPMITGWDVKTGKKLGEYTDRSAPTVIDVTAANESAVVVSDLVRLWVVDFERGEKGAEIDAFPTQDGRFTGRIAFSSDRKRFAIGVEVHSRQYGVRVYSWPECKKLADFRGHAGPITALQFSPDGKTLASGSQDTTVLLWDLSAIEK